MLFFTLNMTKLLKTLIRIRFWLRVSPANKTMLQCRMNSSSWFYAVNFSSSIPA